YASCPAHSFQQVLWNWRGRRRPPSLAFAPLRERSGKSEFFQQGISAYSAAVDRRSPVRPARQPGADDRTRRKTSRRVHSKIGSPDKVGPDAHRILRRTGGLLDCRRSTGGIAWRARVLL